MIKAWSDIAWAQYLDWQEQDKKTLKKINSLLKSIERDGELNGKGHPERLRGDMAGLCSRRIDEKNRLVYCIRGGTLEIVTCKDYYNDD